MHREAEEFCDGFAKLRDGGCDNRICAVVIERCFAVGDVDAEPALFEALRAT